MSYGALKSRVSDATVRRMIQRALGQDAVVRNRARCRGGLFNTTLRVGLADGRTVILRVAPHPALPLMGVERCLMRREVEMTPEFLEAGLPVPQTIRADLTGHMNRRHWAVTEFMPGANWHYARKRLSARADSDLFRELGRLARRLHDTVNCEGCFGYPPPFRRHWTWSGFVLDYTELLERDMRESGAGPLPADLMPVRLADRMAGVLDEIREPRLVHGDLWPRNILFKDGRITALLDGDRALWGDPRFEWVLYGYPMKPAFWRAYGPKHPKSRHARMRNLLYRGCGALQASLEEHIHFRHRAKARELMGYAVRDLGAVRQLLDCGALPCADKGA